MTRRLIIAIDCDDVLISTTPYLVDEYNRLYKTHVTIGGSHDSGSGAWGSEDKKVILGRLTDIQASKEYAVLQPFDDAISAVRRLAAHHELHLVTARDEAITEVTMTMLNDYLHKCFMSVEHVGDGGLSKGEVCKRLHADILIDDNVKHLTSALEHGLTLGGALHFGDYPWNRSEASPEGVVRCDNWDEVEQKVAEIAKR